MKKIKCLCLLFLSVLSITSCMKDNMDGPDAQFYGSIRDVLDNSLVEQDPHYGSQIEAYEHGYENPKAMFWDLKINGEFRNDLVFSNTYDFYLRNGNFFAITELNMKINPGINEYVFKVVPYLRILDAKISLNKDDDKIEATFRIQGGDNTVKMDKIALFAWSDMYVGDQFKFDINGGGNLISFSPSVIPNEEIVYKLSIDLKGNSDRLIKGRSYFFRIGALANVKNQGVIRMNYATNVKITL